MSEAPEPSLLQQLRARRREAAAVGAAALVLALLALAPVLGDLQGRLLGYFGSENFSGAWLIRWGQWSLLERHRWPMVSPYTGYPTGDVVQCLPFFSAVLFLPLYELVNPIAVYNLSAAWDIALAFIGAWLLLRDTCERPLSALPGTLGFALSSYMLGHLATGPVESFSIGWIPLSIWAARRSCLGDRTRWGRVVLTGAVLGFTFLANPYYLIFSSLAAAWWVLTDRRGTPLWKVLGRAAISGALALAILAPQAITIRDSLSDPRTILDEKNDPMHLLMMLGTEKVVDLLSFFLPTEAYNKHSILTEVYLGLPLLGAALLGLRRRGAWRYLLLLAGVLIFALGGVLEVGGERVMIGDKVLSLPALFLCLNVPPFTLITHPYRSVPVALLAMGALAGGWLDGLPAARSRRAAQVLSALILIEALAISPGGLPAPTSAYHEPQFYRDLADDPGEYAIWDVHEGTYVDDFGLAMLYQQVHGKYTPYTLGALPQWMLRNPFAHVLMWEEWDLGPIRVPQDPCPARRDLRELGFKYLVKHKWGRDPDPKMDRLRECLDAPVYEDDEVRVYAF